MARPENRSGGEGAQPDAADRNPSITSLSWQRSANSAAPRTRVATHILVREVYAMHARGFHEMRDPTAVR